MPWSLEPKANTPVAVCISVDKVFEQQFKKCLMLSRDADPIKNL